METDCDLEKFVVKSEEVDRQASDTDSYPSCRDGVGIYGGVVVRMIVSMDVHHQSRALDFVITDMNLEITGDLDLRWSTVTMLLRRTGSRFGKGTDMKLPFRK